MSMTNELQSVFPCIFVTNNTGYYVSLAASLVKYFYIGAVWNKSQTGKITGSILKIYLGSFVCLYVIDVDQIIIVIF